MMSSGDSFWMPFKLACHPSLPPPVREVALDGIQQLLAHGLLNGTARVQLEGAREEEPKILLIEEIVATVCGCYGLVQSEHTVQLQVLKVLLTIVSCTHCQIDSVSLLKIVESCFGIHVNSKSTVNQATAKASLTQITNAVNQEVQRTFVMRHESDLSDLPTSPVVAQDVDASVPTANLNGSNHAITKDIDAEEAITKDVDAEEAITKDVDAEEAAESEKESVTVNPDPDTILKVDGKVASLASLLSSESLTELHQLTRYQQARKNAMQLFRLLCRVSNQTDQIKQPQADGLTESLASLPVDEISANTLKARLLALDMILSIFNNAGPTFLDDELTIKIIRRYLCFSISRNGISSNTNLFELSLSIFLLVIRHFRHMLKVEVGILFNTVFLHILTMSSSTHTQKLMILQALQKIYSNPQILSDIFINYDCDINSVSLFEKSVLICCKLAQSKAIVPDKNQTAIYNIAVQAIGFENKNEVARAQEKRLIVQSLGCLAAITKSQVIWSTHKTFQARENSGGSDAFDEQVTVVSGKNPLSTLVISELAHARAMTDSIPTTVNIRNSVTEGDDGMLTGQAGRKQRLSQAILLFNTEPNKAIKRLIDASLLENVPQSVADFLLNTVDLSKTAIGEYIGHSDTFNRHVMHEFIDNLNLETKGFVEALRFMLQTFRLPGEAIDRIMEKFADRYCGNNPEVFSKADTAYTLAFSVIMLNTDLHSLQIKNRMDKNAFIKNNKGINDSGDLPEEFLSSIFDEIQSNEIVMNEEQAHHLTAKQQVESEMNEAKKREFYSLEVAQVQKKSLQLIRSAVHSPFTHATQKELAKPMFSLVSWPMMAVFSLIFEAALDEEDAQAESTHIYDPHIVQYCLDGFEHGIYLACTFKLDTERDAYITSLANLAGFSRVNDLKMKNVRAMKSILGIALDLGDHLDASWIHVVKTISQIEKLSTALNGNIDEDQDAADIADKKVYTSYMIQVFGLISNIKSDGVINELSGQAFVLLSDQIFSQSNNLSPDAILHFFRAMCAVSLEEVGLTSDLASMESLKQKPKVHFEDVKLAGSRVHMLQKIVEVACYNIDRIRLEWAQIWRVLQKHFNTIGCHENASVSTMNIDSMRLLCMKFLEKDELANYNTQSQFLKSFEWIMKRTRSSVTKELIVGSIAQMITLKSVFIRSGWSSILATLSNIRDTDESVRIKAFLLVQTIYAEHFDHILSYGAFTDFISCLVEFALMQEGSVVQDQIVSDAFEIIEHCSRYIVSAKLSSKPLSRRGSFISRDSVLESSPSEAPLDIKSDDAFYLKWFPVFAAFSKISLDASSENVQMRGLNALFGVLQSTSHLLDCSHWLNIFKSIITPLFENLEDDYASNVRDSAVSKRSLNDKPSILIHGLSLLVNLFNRIFSMITLLAGGDEVFKIVIDTILSMYSRRDEKFATTAGICLNKLLESNIEYIVESNQRYMEIATEALEKAFELTVPAELLNCVYPARGASQESLELSPRASDTAGLSPLSISFSNEVLPSISTLAVLSFVSQRGREIAARVCVDAYTLDTLDFNQVILKCGMHLEYIESLRNLIFSPVDADIDEEDVEASKPLVVMLQPDFRKRWLYLIYSSYCVARSFNANYDLRQSIWKKGLIKQLPNLVRQETLACSLYIQVLLAIYKHEPTDTDILEELVRETIDVLQRCDDLLQNQAKNARDIGVWVQVVVMIFRELVAFDELWKDDERYAGLRGSIGKIIRLCVKMIAVDSGDVRGVLRIFLEKAHSIMVVGF